jgi:hypothetical protein
VFFVSLRDKEKRGKINKNDVRKRIVFNSKRKYHEEEIIVCCTYVHVVSVDKLGADG